jgi:hypothetical protein
MRGEEGFGAQSSADRPRPKALSVRFASTSPTGGGEATNPAPPNTRDAKRNSPPRAITLAGGLAALVLLWQGSWRWRAQFQGAPKGRGVGD